MANRVILLEGAKLDGLDGTSNGDVLTWSSGTSSWSSAAPIAAQYDFAGQAVGNPATGEVIYRLVPSRNITISSTSADHQFYCTALPGSGSVTLTVKKTPLAGGGAVTVLVATYTAGGSVSGNGLYAATVGSVSNNTAVPGDLITIEVGTTDPSFTTPVFTVYASM
jgi:hypothetical protein